MGGAIFNDVRRDDGGSAAITLQSLANKDYGAIKNRRRGVTARDGCDIFNKEGFMMPLNLIEFA